VGLQLDVSDPAVCFEDDIVARGVDIRSDHLDVMMTDEPAVLEHFRQEPVLHDVLDKLRVLGTFGKRVSGATRYVGAVHWHARLPPP